MEINGIQYSQQSVKYPRYSLPDDWTGLKIALKMVGGIGDCCISIGGAAKALKNRYNCDITAVVFEHQINFIKMFDGVDDAVRAQSLNKDSVRSSFDVILDFQYSFNNQRELLAKNYYELASKKAGIKIHPGSIRVEETPIINKGSRIIAVHPGASNPNRRWINYRWKQLATELVKRGFILVWLGTHDELAYVGHNSYKLSETNNDIVFQTRALAGCDYFIGCDSGFAHLAGVLGVPGSVIFTNTEPEHVISEYPSLQGITKYSKILRPSRSLRAYDEMSEKVKSAITHEDILNATGFATNKIVVDQVELLEHERQVVSLFYGDRNTELHKKLTEIYKVDLCLNKDNFKRPFFSYDDNQSVVFELGRRTIKVNSLDEIQRSVREVMSIK